MSTQLTMDLPELAEKANEEHSAAIRTAEKAIELGSTHELVLRARWDAYRNLGDEAKTAEALAAMEHTGRMAEEAKKVFNEGVGLFKAGDFENAFLKYQEASILDIFPTLLDLLGLAHPDPGRPIDGISVRALIEGDTSSTRPQPIGFWITHLNPMY